MDGQRDAKIGPTAHYTAYVWHRLGLPHAELFVTARGARLFWALRLGLEALARAMPGVPTMPEYLAMRHLTIERALERIEPDRVVEIGAGLSRRGITWAADRGVAYLEVDLPHMIDRKRALIAERAPAELRARAEGKLRHVSHDVLDRGFGDWLARELQGARRPVVVAEGLLGYFDLDERTAIVRAVCRGLSSAGGGTFLCDLRHAEGGAAMKLAVAGLKLGIRVATYGRGARRDLQTFDEAQAMLTGAGFAEAEPLEQEGMPRRPGVVVPSRIWQARL